jgi:hypothetical protein
MTSSGRVRLRRRAYNPEFETGFNFLPELARFDKISINFDIAGVEGATAQQVFENFRRVAGNSEFLRLDGRGYNRNLKIRRNMNRGLRQRTGDTSPYNKPLFTGYIKYDTQEAPRLRAFLNINPTRYFAYNPSDRIYPDYCGEENVFSTLFEDGDIKSELKRNAAVGDNFILSDRLQEAYEENWIRQTIDYAILCGDLLREEIAEHSGLYPHYSFYNGLRNWTINHFECYWEYTAPDADAPYLVKQFCKHLSKRLKSSRERVYPSEVNTSQEISTFIFSARNKKRNIAIYAKSDDRLRVECRFEGNPLSMYSNWDRDRYPTTRRGISDMISDLREKAIEALQPIQTGYNSFNFDDMPRPAHIARQLSTLYSVTRNNTAQIRRIIEANLSDERIVEPEVDNGYRRVLRQLAKEGVLDKVKSTNPREYILNEPLASLLKA